MTLRNLFFAASMVLLCAQMSAQDLNISVNKSGKVGFTDRSGNVVVDYKYDSAMPFKDGAALVSKSSRWGMVDTQGKEIVPVKYLSVEPWYGNLYKICSGKYGLVDNTGHFVLDVQYSIISAPNSHGKALIGMGGKVLTNNKRDYVSGAKYGIVDNTGKVLIPAEHKGLYEFLLYGSKYTCYTEGMRLAYDYHYMDDTLSTDCRYLGYGDKGTTTLDCGVMDGNGNVLVPSGEFNMVFEPKNGMVRYYSYTNTSTTCGYYNIEKKTSFVAETYNKGLNNISFWTHGDFNDSIAPVNSNNNYWEYIDKDGNVLRQGYRNIRQSNVLGLWAAKKEDGKWDVFDYNNTDKPQLTGFNDIQLIQHEGDEELYTVEKDSLYGVIDRNGKQVIPFKYAYAFDNRYGVIAVKAGGKWGALSTTGKQIIPIKYQSIIFPTERNTVDFWVVKDSVYYHFNSKTQKQSPKGYSNAWNFKNGLAKVIPLKSDAEYKDKESGYYINTNDVRMNSGLIPAEYNTTFREAIQKNDNKPLTQHQTKDINLQLTLKSRTYNLSDTISQDDWNY